MFEGEASVTAAAGAAAVRAAPSSSPSSSPLSAPAVRGWAGSLAGLVAFAGAEGSTDVERVELIAALEVLKSAAAAAQARVSADLDASVRARHAAAGLPADQHGRGVGAQVALARQDSPVRGGQHLGLAKALVHEMPHTLAALSTGRLSEWRATLLVRETACLTRADRARVDAEARRAAYRLDPAAALRRASKAEQDRRSPAAPPRTP